MKQKMLVRDQPNAKTFSFTIDTSFCPKGGIVLFSEGEVTFLIGIEVNHEKNSILAANKGFILCEVNCLGVMGASSFTKRIKRLYPEVFNVYADICKRIPSEELLGRVQVIQSDNKDLYFIFIFGQLEYGRNESIVYLNYEAFENSLKTVNQMFHGETIMITNYIGCEKTSNGDWNKVLPILQNALKDCKCVFSDE